MDIMDDVLDLKDSLGDVGKERRKARASLRGESGFSTLVIVLVIMAVGAVIITPLLVVLVVTGQRAGRPIRSQRTGSMPPIPAYRMACGSVLER